MLVLMLLLLLLQRNLQRAICGREQQWGVILRLRCVDIVVECVLLRLVEQLEVMVMLLLLLLGRRQWRGVVVVEVVKALVRVRAWVGRIGGDGLHHVGQWCWPSTRSLRSSRRSRRCSGPTDGRRDGR